jgi:hypothetical protein
MTYDQPISFLSIAYAFLFPARTCILMDSSSITKVRVYVWWAIFAARSINKMIAAEHNVAKPALTEQSLELAWSGAILKSRQGRTSKVVDEYAICEPSTKWSSRRSSSSSWRRDANHWLHCVSVRRPEGGMYAVITRRISSETAYSWFRSTTNADIYSAKCHRNLRWK